MGAALSCLDGSGRQLLAAAIHGRAPLVREVLERKPELGNYTYLGHTYNAAHYAAEAGHLEVLRALVETLEETLRDATSGGGGDPDHPDLKSGHLNRLSWGRFLKDLLNARSNTGFTPLMLAAEHGHTACVRYLLDQGADPFPCDKLQNRSVLHCAAAGKHVEVLRVLLDEGLRVNTEGGLTPLRVANVLDISGNCRFIDTRAENGLSALHIAAALGDLPSVQLLLASGASMMVRTVDLDMMSPLSFAMGSTPLHLAAQGGHLAILQAMLQAHADALGTLGQPGLGANQRWAWEGDGRIDLRSVANASRQLPYHVAWQRGFRQAARILNPTIPIVNALETARTLEDGYGPHRLSTLAAFALRKGLLLWLVSFKVEKEAAARMQAKHALHSCAAATTATGTKGGEGAMVGQQGRPAPLSRPVLSGASAACPQGTGVSRPAPPALPVPGRPSRPAAAAQAALVSQDMPSTAGAAAGPAHARPRPHLDGGQGPEGGAAATLAGGPAAVERGLEEGGPPGPTPPLGQPRVSRTSSSGNLRAESRRALAAVEETAAAAFVSPFQSESTRVTEDGGGSVVSKATDSDPGTHPCSALGQDTRPCSPTAGLSAVRAVSFARGLSRHSSHSDATDMERQGSRVVQLLGPDSQEDPQQEVARSAPSLGASRRLNSTSRRRSRQPSMDLGGRAASAGALRRQASVTGFDADADSDCGICLESSIDVAINGCNHSLCVDCALKLCELAKKPPFCPFCRVGIEGFHAAVAAPGS